MAVKTIETKLFFEDNIWNKRNEGLAENYLAHRVKEADPESEFGRKMGDLIKAPYEIIIQNIGMFKEQNYEIMLSFLKDKGALSLGIITGHIAFQQHDDGWHVFQCYTEPSFRNKGYAHALTAEILKYARKKSIKQVRFGKEGGHDSMESLLERLEERKDLKVSLDTHWVELI